MFNNKFVNGVFCAMLVLLVEDVRSVSIEEIRDNNNEHALVKWTPNSNQSTENYFKKLQDFCKANNMSVPRYIFSKNNNGFNCKVQIDDKVFNFTYVGWESENQARSEAARLVYELLANDEGSYVKEQLLTVDSGPALSKYSQQAIKFGYHKLEDAIIRRDNNSVKIVIKELLNRGIKVNVPYLNFTFLTFSAGWGNKEIVRYLIEEVGAKVDSKDHFGNTPLFYAIKYGHEDVVMFLIEKGANLNDITLNGKYQRYRTAFDLAAFFNKPSILNMLLDMRDGGKTRFTSSANNSTSIMLDRVKKQIRWLRNDPTIRKIKNYLEWEKLKIRLEDYINKSRPLFGR